MEQRPIGVIGAMKIEVDAILAALEEPQEKVHGNMVFTSGRLSGVPVVVAQCSPGKVNAALCTQALIDFYAPRLVLNIGVAGGIGENVHIGDVVIATACVEYDFDTSALDQCSAGQMSVPGQEGLLDQFPCDEAAANILAAAGEGLQKEFGALACEMEGGAIAHACLVNNVPCAVLRTISDNAHDSETVDFLTFAASSAQKAQQLLGEVLPRL